RTVGACAAKKVERHSQIFGCQSALLGKALGCQVVRIAIDRNLAHLDQALAHATPQIRVCEAESNSELARKIALDDCAVTLDRCEHAQHDARIAGVFDLRLLRHTDRSYPLTETLPRSPDERQ